MKVIYGIGIDIIEVSRIEKQISSERKRFREILFSENEIKYCDDKKSKAQNYAARFAAKEAFLKAIGTGLRDGLNWKNIEILNDELGKPEIVLHGKAKKIIKENGISNINVSLSHLKETAVAVVILEKVM